MAILVAAVAVVAVTLTSTSGHRSAKLRAAAAAHRAKPKPPPPPPQLPRGGRTLLPGHLIVAYYGVVGTSNILGQTGSPEADAAGVEHRAAAYTHFGEPVQPAFELVTTVASPYAGKDGSYSSPVKSSLVDQYLATAHRHKLLLILDFQPGRGEFLPEVRRYARYLRDPSVGVGLDPEWKLTPDEYPDEVIGHSSAASINAVSAYLSRLVARDRLPQKLLVVHEFKTSELPDRQNIVIQPNLATVLQMDGFGALSDKLGSFHEVVRGAHAFHIGFKLFLRPVDDPVLLTPAQVMSLHPRPEYISYQ